MNGEERRPAGNEPDQGFSLRDRILGDKLTIRRKLMAIMLVTSTLTVFIASSAFIAFSWFARRQALERDLASLAPAIGNTCEVALQFGIPDDAERILATVEARPAIVLACIYDADGQLFAAHDPESRAAIALPLEAGPDVDVHDHVNGVLRLTHPVHLKTRRIGTVYLEADMREIRAALGRDSLILGGVALLALVGSYLLSSRFQGLISGPILGLAATAQTISEVEDHSIRAEMTAGGEMATLVQAFNGMLDAIEVRDSALVAGEKRYQTLFDTAEVSLWEQDISEVRQTMQELSAQGVSDLRRYLEEHPEFVARAAGQVRVVDVNSATVQLFDGASKDDLLGSLDSLFIPESLPVIREKLIAIAVGRRSFAAEAVHQTLTGRRIVALLSMALPREDETQHAIVSMMDITERKATEEELDRHRNHLTELVEKRTVELRKMVNLMAGREVRMAELKEVTKKLRAQLEEAGMTPVADDPLRVSIEPS